MQVWNVLHAARWKYRTQKIAKIRHLGTIAQLCWAVSSQLRHASTIEKNLLNSNISSRCPRNMANVGPTAEMGLVWGTPANLNQFHVLASLLQRRRSPEANQTLHDLWPFPGLVHYTTYISLGLLPPDGILLRAKFTLRPSLAFCILAALLHGTPAAGLSQTLRRGTRNGITKLSQTAPSIFGWTAITLGIGPHSSYNLYCSRFISCKRFACIHLHCIYEFGCW